MKRLLAVISLLLLVEVACAQITNVRKWRKGEKDSLDNALLLYEENQYLMALPIFESILNHHPNEEFIKYSFAKCAIYRSDKHEDAYKYLSEIYARNKKVDEIDYDVAKSAHYSNKLDEAMAAVNRYLSKKHITPENKQKGELLKRYIINATYYVAIPTAARITDLDDSVNTGADEYGPAITADESSLVFTYSGYKSTGGLMNDQSQSDPNGIYHEDIYISKRMNGLFSAAVPVSNLNTQANDAAVSLSNDGSTLYLFRDNTDDHGDLYESHLEGNAYSSPAKLKGLVNSYSWDGHCSLSPDGKTLYFSSERGGGYGGKDIYKSTLQPDSTWGNILNLGDSINSPSDEDAPFIHADGKTLYFSSKGRSSMGGYDVFRCTMNAADSLFKNTESLGYPINTTDDDIYFVVAANNKTAYYSSGRSGGKGLKDIYSVEPNFSAKAPVYLVKGTVKVDSLGAASVITVEIPSKNNEMFAGLTSNSATGAYLVALPAGSAYKLTYSMPGQVPQTFSVSADSISDYTESVHDVTFLGSAYSATLQPPVKDTLAVVAPVEAKPVSKDGFTPQTRYQAKLMDYVDKYGDIKADSLEFKVQIGAFKNPDKIVYTNLEDFGKLQRQPAEDGLTRILIGGYFKTLRKAFELNKKVIAAGQSDAFVTMIYKGKRVSLEELETLGIFKTK